MQWPMIEYMAVHKIPVDRNFGINTMHKFVVCTEQTGNVARFHKAIQP